MLIAQVKNQEGTPIRCSNDGKSPLIYLFPSYPILWCKTPKEIHTIPLTDDVPFCHRQMLDLRNARVMPRYALPTLSHRPNPTRYSVHSVDFLSVVLSLNANDPKIHNIIIMEQKRRPRPRPRPRHIIQTTEKDESCIKIERENIESQIFLPFSTPSTPCGTTCVRQG